MLPDLLRMNLKIVFCGPAPGNRSAAQENYYAGCGNKFYCVLYNCGFIPVQLIPSDYKKLLDYNIGLTDLVKTKAGMDYTLNKSDYDINGFTEKIKKCSPQIVCFNGKQAAKEFFGVEKIEYGLQSATIVNTKIFIAPSTAPKAHIYWKEKYWKQLKEIIE